MAVLDRILIVGAGIGGLTLAAALRQRGYSPALIERARAWRPIGAGLAVQPNGVRVLRALGSAAEIELVAAVIRYWDFCDEQGAILCETDVTDLWGGVGPFLGVARSELHRILLGGTAGVPVRLGVTISALTQDTHGVEVGLSDGTRERYDLVVGADGIGSSVRAMAIDNASPVYGGQMVWRVIVPIRPQGLSKLQFLLGEATFFGLCPVGDGSTYGFANVAGPQIRDEVEGRRARVRDRFARFGRIVHEFLDAIDADEQVHCSAIEWLPTEAWYRGRVVLIGDAAHASSPMMGQGGSMAMEDAYVLAELLQGEATIEAALAAYVDRRAPRVRWVRQQSRAAGESLALPVAQRNALLRERGEHMMRARFGPLLTEP